jgi:glycosyltransferase involved in cell wall biosynthesis
MKVTIISTLPPQKGISPYTLGLIEALSKNCDIDFLGFKKLYPDFLYPGGATDPNAVAPRFNNHVQINNCLVWWNPLTWVRAGLSIRTQVVHAQWWSWFLAPVFLTVLTIAKLKHKKIIITVHNVEPHEKSILKKLLNNSVLSLADEYIVHNTANKELFLSLTNTLKPIHIRPLGITNFIVSSSSNISLRRQYKFNLNDKIILYFGNIRDYKGIDILLSSFKKITNPHVKLIIAGKPWDKFDYKIPSRVTTFLDYLPESKVAELFKICDLVVLPYKEFEASSGVATVGVFYEKPLVVTNVGGLPDMVMDPEVVAQANNVADLTKKINYALLHLPTLKEQSVQIKNKFTWSQIAHETQNLYHHR